ncbi:hypothetical protein OIE61_43995 [Streptomyces sp. NBC_01762]|uniref:hypothetical protein n=1 Tax=Streptomyces sp. NBC_01762 TaxID=2975933 RepID=UPI002DDA174B|nr:hypothetical protein [Streptomyces sp. NBC_01762]WSC42615.1 hypothetical protein OIE61_00480 [Streptomyces sp. NBC_01762]WSC50238.1 hypothetical protein OIE61_43995 [Streptomyces sp. NBC_01762]
MSPAPDERDRIRAAIGRILQGTPLRSNGAWTIAALAEEAGVPRNALTQRHPDLKNDFHAQVRARGKTPDSEIRLRKQTVKLKELRVKDVKELSQADRHRSPRPRRQPTDRGEPATARCAVAARLPGQSTADAARPNRIP